VSAGDTESDTAQDRTPSGPLSPVIVEDQTTREDIPRSSTMRSQREPRVRDSGAPEARLGDRIAGRYRIVRELGAGGMGRVYLARDESKDRDVALKILHRHMANNLTVVNRFRREARIMRDLSSPHAVQILDFGQAEDGSLYLAMEYLQGQTLGALLERVGHIEARQVIEMALDMLDVLADAHAWGVIHRDIKPANIFLAERPEGNGPVVKLLDFGIAKLNDQETTDLTVGGAIWGTPRYMSPEQAMGKPVDLRSDLYSLGVVMYRALTGHHPFDGASAVDMLYAQLHSNAEAPDKRRPDIDIPPALGVVVLRALAREPESRYQSAAEMAADLRALGGEPRAEAEARKGRTVTLAVRAWVAVMMVVAVLAALEFPIALRSPFPGFALESGLLVSVEADKRWAGIARGIKPYDLVLAVDGKPVRHAREVREHLRDLPLGTPVTYTLRRDGRAFDVTVPVGRLSALDLFTHYGSLFLSGLSFLIVGAVVGWRNPQSRAVHALLVFTSAFGMLLVAGIDLDHVDQFPWIFRLGVCVGGPAFAHLALSFPGLRDPSQQRPWLRILLYAPALLIFTAWQSPVPDPSVGALCNNLCIALLIAGFVAMLGRLVHARLRGPVLAVREAARFLLWAAGVSVLPSFLFIGLFGAGVQSPVINALMWLAQLLLVLFPLAVAYQIQRARLFDVDMALQEIWRAICNFALLLAVFALPALALAALGKVFEADRTLQLLLGGVGGVAAVSLAAAPVARWLRRFFERRSDVDGTFILDELAAATRGAESADEVFELLFEAVRRRFAPRALRILERGQGFYRVRPVGKPDAPAASMRSDVELDGTSIAREPRNGDPIDNVRRSLTRLGHWNAHATLVLPLEGSERKGAADEAPAMVVVLGARADGKAYASYDAALIAALLRIAALRIQAIGERQNLERRLLLDRCLGPRGRDAMDIGEGLALDAPARGLAIALVLRFSGLDKAAEGLPPKRLKGLVDDLCETAAAAAFVHGGTLHAMRGDEMLFGFGALGTDRGSLELASIEAALDLVEWTAAIVRKYAAPSVGVHVGAARGTVTVGTFGAMSRADCLIIGGAIGEATQLVDLASRGEVLIDDELANILASPANPKLVVEPRPGPAGNTIARVMRGAP
jgi:hypothetical protein